MATRFNAMTGQYEEEDPIAVAPSPAPVIPPPVTSAAPVVPSAAPAPVVPPSPVPPVLAVDKETVTAPGATETITKPTTSGKVVTPEMRGQDKVVEQAVKDGRDALAAQAANDLTRAELEGQKLDLERRQKENEAKDAQARDEALNRRQAALKAQADADVAAEAQEAAHNQRGFFADQTTASKILWGLSLLAGAGAKASGRENVGLRLLDKSMDDWSAARQKELDRLGQHAKVSGGLLAKFVEDWGPEAQARKLIKDAAGYTHVAEEMRGMVDKRAALLTAEAKAATLQKAADYDAKAAEKKQQALEARAATYHSGTDSVTRTTGGVTTTSENPALKPSLAADKARAEQIFTLDGKPAGKALTKEEGEKIRAAQGATNGLLDTLERLKEFNTQHGTWNVSPTKTQERDLLIGNATAYLTQAFQTGTLQQAEFNRYSKMLAGSMIQSGPDSAKGLETLAVGMRNAYDAKVKSQGIDLEPQGGMSLEAKARATKPGDPLYDSAQRWLKAHGL